MRQTFNEFGRISIHDIWTMRQKVTFTKPNHRRVPDTACLLTHCLLVEFESWIQRFHSMYFVVNQLINNATNWGTSTSFYMGSIYVLIIVILTHNACVFWTLLLPIQKKLTYVYHMCVPEFCAHILYTTNTHTMGITKQKSASTATLDKCIGLRTMMRLLSA